MAPPTLVDAVGKSHVRSATSRAGPTFAGNRAKARKSEVRGQAQVVHFEIILLIVSRVVAQRLNVSCAKR